jgi:integrase
LKPSTARGYEAIIRTKINPEIGAIPLQGLTGVDIARAWGELRTDGRRDGKGGLSETTILQCHAVVHRALNHAVRARLISRNVAGDLDRPKITKTEMRTWTTDQVRQFLTETDGERLGAVWEVAVRTGMRRGELLGLQWADIDLKRGTIVVRRSRVAAGGTVTEGSPKSGRARTITVAPTVIAALEVWQQRQREERIVWPTDEAFAQGYVFTREDGTPANAASISQAFDRRVARTELPRLRFHDLRHTCASLMLESGVDLVTISRHLGHGSIAITADTYGHVSPAMAADAVLRLDAHIAGH